MYHLIAKGNVKNDNLNKYLDVVRQVFEKAGKELEVHVTDHPGHAKEITAELTAGGEFAHLIAMGGDGTLHEVLNGIEDTENCTLGLIPIGSGNDFATATGIMRDVKVAAENIAFRAPQHIDYIQLSDGLRSINAVGTGMDVDVLKRAYSGVKGKKNGRHGKYFAAFLQSFKHYECTAFKVSFDGNEEKTHECFIACLGNGVCIGGGIKLFPEAKISDGYMDFLVVDKLSRFKMLFCFLKLKKGRVHKIKGATYVKCKRATILPMGDSFDIQAEGEIYEKNKIEAEIVSGKLKFYLPRE